ncbi:MAG: hypothetical protein COW52_04460 [Nitrospirae bacterium CG17_big_fil_post_rev_8_21_14_2_50_50_9]|nr:MAG: hypothetical protein COW52_04460 [Nitrospirae bacterium CG17_big_fil_post_rev_8_21_14_2_50_50_9]
MMVAKVTIEDVRSAVGEVGGDPSATNSAIIREKLGRGSMSTIQGHLYALRKEVENEEALDESIEVPGAPKDVLEPVWNAAWLSARLMFLQRMDSLNRENSQLRFELRVTQEDRDTLLEEVRSLEFDVEKISAGAESSIAALEKQCASYLSDISTMEARLDEAHKLNSQISSVVKMHFYRLV